jgi:putative transposase
VQRRIAKPRPDEDILTAAIIALARRFGRYGYRMIGDLLRRIGWKVNDKRVERIWRREGLQVPQKQPKRDSSWTVDVKYVDIKGEKHHSAAIIR